MNKNILLVIDETEFKYFEFNRLVTNFWFIFEFLKRGYNVDITVKGNLFVENGSAKALTNDVFSQNNDIFYKKEAEKKFLNDFDIVFFRPDPPVDTNYIDACYVFDFVDKQKTLLINDPTKVKDFNEKLHINYFPNYIPKNIVTSSKMLIKKFVNEETEAIIKPLNRLFGSGVYYLRKGDKNINTIIDSITNSEKTPVMVQKFIPSKIRGDKRVLSVGKKVFKESVIKLASNDDFKFNNHSDDYFTKTVLTEKERKIAQDVANFLYSKGIYIVGLDMIEETIIEINITSPCFFIKEINNFYNTNFEIKIVDEIEKIADEFFAKNNILSVV